MTEWQRLTATRYPHACLLATLSALEHTRVDFPEQLQQPARRGGDGFVSTLPILDKVAEQFFLHRPGLTSADLSNCVQARSDDFTAYSWVNELLRELSDYRC